VFFLARTGGAPEMYRELTRWWAPGLLAVTTACALAALWALWSRRYRIARAAAAGQVTLILTGWAAAQFPQLIVPDVDIWSVAAPPITLKWLVAALAAGAVILLPSLAYLFRVFKGRAAVVPTSEDAEH
jgi:cytochrome d ubiquinol oxidase subunit II